MRIRMTEDLSTHKTGDEQEIDQAGGQAMIDAGVAELVEQVTFEADADDDAAVPDPPAKSASKDEWVEFAESQGDDDAASKTKQELIDEHS
jgi:hypothetical protein